VVADHQGGEHKAQLNRHLRPKSALPLKSNVMQFDEITLALFATCNSIRVFAYIPQIRKAATDMNGASAISRTTWSLFLVAHVSTIGYALVNRSDLCLAVRFIGNALCCLAILLIAFWKGRRHVAPAAQTCRLPRCSISVIGRPARVSRHQRERAIAARE
jgi:hypothetical protein